MEVYLETQPTPTNQRQDNITGNYKELEEALLLVENLCTTEQIQNLLRSRKDDKNVRVTAETKEELVNRNLKAAVESKAIEIKNVFDLIRSSEENGNQHIFYYKPKSRHIAEALTFESIAQQLWKMNWKETLESFPAIKLKPNNFQYSDFRLHSKRDKDWILKIYGHTVITKFTGKIKEGENNSFWREYIEEPLRIVLLARWNSLGLLEIRVQRNESRKRVDDWHVQVWKMLNPALVRGQFEQLELSKTMAQLITRQSANEKVYNFRDASVVGLGVRARFEAVLDDGNLFASIETRDSIQSYLNAQGECKGLTVTWIKQDNGRPQKDIRTLLAAKEVNEIVVFPHCTSEDMDYVADRLRQFNK